MQIILREDKCILAENSNTQSVLENMIPVKQKMDGMKIRADVEQQIQQSLKQSVNISRRHVTNPDFRTFELLCWRKCCYLGLKTALTDDWISTFVPDFRTSLNQNPAKEKRCWQKSKHLIFWNSPENCASFQFCNGSRSNFIIH